IRKGTPEDIEGLVRCQDKRSVYLNRFIAGDTCLVATINGEIAGHEWFCSGDAYIEERFLYKIKLNSDEIYSYDGFILEEHRIQGIWMKFKVDLSTLMASLGKRKVMTLIDYGNELSMKTHLRFGFYPIKSVIYMNIFGWSFFKERTLSPEDNILLSNPSFPSPSRGEG
ncbi:MAG TPA: hypothetical protein VN944_09265, partial [Nitrospiria bacterium]|nr:hypothetical protein [Nitrospiria bacterium]